MRTRATPGWICTVLSVYTTVWTPPGEMDHPRTTRFDATDAGVRGAADDEKAALPAGVPAAAPAPTRLARLATRTLSYSSCTGDRK